MTQDEYNEAAALVVRLRKELEHTNQHLVAHIDALTKSNAQCGEYLRRNEQLHSELVEVRAALALVTGQRDSLRSTLAEWERADTEPHTRIDEVAQVVPVCMQCLKERIKTAHDYETGPSVAILTKPLLPDDVADHVVPPVLPLCNVCHECGSELANCSQGTNHHDCPRPLCPRTCTGRHGGGFSPYSGPCKSATPVRHE